MNPAMTKSGRGKRWGRTAIFILALIVAGVGLAYPLSNLLRAPLDDAARAKLIRTGKTGSFRAPVARHDARSRNGPR
jgi:hypothetical protein